MRLTDKERAKRKRLAADYLAFRIEHKRPGTGDEVTAWIAERDAAAIPERKEVSPQMARALRQRALDMMAKLVCRDASGCTKNGACLYIDCQHNPHYLRRPGKCS
jgi:hypothetical protein